MTLRQHLLAALVVAHVAIITIQAIPLPRKVMTEGALTRSGARESIDLWFAPLVTAGLLEDTAGVAGTLLAWNNAIVEQRRAVLRPLRRYYALTGTGQSWRMFSTVSPEGARLQIHLQPSAGGSWAPLYIEHSTHRWRARLLNQERVRTVRSSFSRHNGLYRDAYERLALWLAQEAAAEFPDAHALRVRYQKLLIHPPARIRRDGGIEAGKLFWETTHALEPLR